ncbi:alpha/beta hydrolase [Arthrobacter sp. FW305-123]|nr:alpha/beta hydrolase [Arthrobacter sp. FW305-123]
MRGHGHADKPETGYSLVEVAEDIVALLGDWAIPRVTGLGSSSGGYVAQQLAAANPERVAALVLVGAPLSLRGKPPLADEVESLNDPISESWVRKTMSWYRLLHTVPAPYIEERVHGGLAMPAAIWKASLQGLYEAIPPTEAGTISVPAIILWGAHDHLIPRRHQETLVDRIPGSQLKIYEGTSHLVLWECPEPVAEDTSRFLPSSS